MTDGIRWERLAAMLFCVGVGAVALWYGARLFIPILLPFLVAWLLSRAVRPYARRLSALTHMKESASTVFLFLLLLIGLSTASFLLVKRLLLEASELLERLLTHPALSGAVDGEVDFFEQLTSSVPLLRRVEAGERFERMHEGFNRMVLRCLEELAASLSSRLPDAIGGLLSAIPGLLLSLIVSVVAGFYLCARPGEAEATLLSVLPKRLRARVPAWKRGVKRISLHYVRVYLLLMALTFLVLLFGFSLLRVRYAALLALVVAVIDVLPVLGVGTVLVPWSIVALLQHDLYLGFGLLILYGAALVLHQILEPRLLGKSLGLNPLLTLLASYAGWMLFGLVGMLTFPLLLIPLRSLWMKQPHEY